MSSLQRSRSSRAAHNGSIVSSTPADVLQAQHLSHRRTSASAAGSAQASTSLNSSAEASCKGTGSAPVPIAGPSQAQPSSSPLPRRLPDPLPVAVCHTLELAPQATLGQAAMQLLAALDSLPQAYAGLQSGCVRVEVALPASCTALMWLAGQVEQEQQPIMGNVAARSKQLSLYFSGRHSSAPDTPLASQAELSTKGWAAVAGLGAAWHWQGQAGGGVGSTVVQQIQRFLSSDQPHVRVLGGTRFDACSQPSPEWQSFGAYLFVLPLLEFSERGSGCVLAATMAWDAALAVADTGEGNGVSTNASFATPVWGSGAAILEAAVQAARQALLALRPPQRPSAGAPRLSQHQLQHAPLEEEWNALLGHLLQDLGSGPKSAACTSSAQASAPTGRPGVSAPAPDVAVHQGFSLDMNLAHEEYLTRGQQGLDDLLAAVGGAAARPSQLVAANAAQDVLEGSMALVDPDQGTSAVLSKVVLARRTQLMCEGHVNSLWLLEAVQERDPRAYQLFVSDGCGRFFLACTPERLYARTGCMVASEAVAATRARGPPGDVERDFWLSIELLNSDKDHREFVLVRDWIRDALASCSERVDVEVPKSVLKQDSLQHLYGRMAARLRPGVNDSHILQALHPTPAVCGRPRDAAMQWLRDNESFDRGFYAGPFGWVSGQGAEFAVAIRSSLIAPARPSTGHDSAQPPLAPRLGASSGVASPSTTPSTTATTTVLMYAGVGVVPGSEAAREWAELDLKIRQFWHLLRPLPGLASLPNINLAWASLLVEELCRQGVNMFCVAPGSRSSPLALAVSSHPRARLNVCVDERSLGFWALGYGRAARRPAAVITSSGTAVANLLPACVEAFQSEVPLLLLTADRPAELRDTGANQTIDQVRIFGSYTRWFQDVAAPHDGTPGRLVLSAVATALRHCMGSTGGSAAPGGAPAGPVHLNLQFREPLAPMPAPWQPPALMQGLAAWSASPSQVYTSNGASRQPLSVLAPLEREGALPPRLAIEDVVLQETLAQIWRASRGLIVIGEVQDPAEVNAALQLAGLLGWPAATDILSGLRTTHTDGTASHAASLEFPHQASSGAVADSSSSPRHASPQGACLLHFMDHVLLGDTQAWEQLAPQMVLQLGPRITSKRLNQFMEWAASNRGATWVYVGTSAARHDAAHAVRAHLCMSVRDLASCLVACQPCPPPQPQPDQRPLNGGAHAPRQPRWPQHEQQQRYRLLLASLDRAARDEVAHALGVLPVLTEPGVARAVSQLLPPSHALFLGNSMPIRDMDMYAAPRTHGPSRTPPQHHHPLSAMGTLGGGGGACTLKLGASPQPQPYLASTVRTAANRGASGIDGVLSTAAGFAEGLMRPTTLVVGDLSFLHDSNGLNMLRGGEARSPLTVVLINNNGGGIFSFLPIAGAVPPDQFEPLWGTPQNADFGNLCRAHGLPYQRVTALPALDAALQAAWSLNRHSVIEVVTDRSTNVLWHRWVQQRVGRAVSVQLLAWAAPPADARHSPRALGPTAAPTHLGPAVQPCSAQLSDHTWAGALPGAHVQVAAVAWQRFSLPLARPLTTTSATQGSSRRQGLVLELEAVGPGGRRYCGRGEVAPLPGLHAEDLATCEAQLHLVADALRGAPLPLHARLLGGRLHAALFQRTALAGLAGDLVPSVRSGLEFAALDLLAQCAGGAEAAAAGQGACSLLSSHLLSPCPVRVCGLVAEADEQAAVRRALQLVSVPHSHGALKIKVARSESTPAQDARCVLAIRQVVGPGVVLRADANRGWGLQQAVEFGRLVAGAGLEFVEEAVQDPSELPSFFQATGVLYALDESLDVAEPLSVLEEHLPGDSRAGTFGAAASLSAHPRGLAAVVLKPSVLGGPEATLALAATATLHRLQVIISSPFDGPVGMAGLLELASAVDQLAADAQPILEAQGQRQPQPAASTLHHGLGTLGWFEESTVPAGCVEACAGGVVPKSSATVGSVNCQAWSKQLLGTGGSAPPLPPVAPSAWSSVARDPRVRAEAGSLCTSNSSVGVGVRLHGLTIRADGSGVPVSHVVFLHGFLGSKEDWLPHMRALAALGFSCSSIDLPGHGESAHPAQLSVEEVADALASVLRERDLAGCLLVGYSMGARVAMSTAIRHPKLVGSLACISGTPGIKDPNQAQRRAEADAQLARVLVERSLDYFLRMWYSQPLWASLRQCPAFPALMERRLAASRGNESALAASLTWGSTGRMASMWAELHSLTTPLLLVTGHEDEKFNVISRHIQKVAKAARFVKSVSVPGCGHAVHVEKPWAVVSALAQWIAMLAQE